MAKKIIEIKAAEQKERIIDVPFAVSSTKQDDDSGIFRFEGYGSTFNNVDLVNDRIIKGAFLRTIDDWEKSGKKLPALWHHLKDTPIGVYESLREDDKGLFVKGMLPMEDDFVRGRLIPQLKIGSITAMSIGYYLWKYTIDEDSGVWDLLEIELTEISLVTRPANPLAELTSIGKNLPLSDLENLSERELERILRNGVSFSRKDAKKLVSLISKSNRDDLGLTERDAKEIRSKILESFKF